MEVVAPGKFTANLAGEDREVVISFGLRSEILKVLTKKQLEYRSISAKNMLPTELRAKLAEAVDELDAERKKPVKEGEATDPEVVYQDRAKVDELQEKVNKLYEESIQAIDDNRDEVTTALAMGMINLTDDAMAEILVLALTKRGPTGEVTKAITKEQILHGSEFAGDADELLSLVEGIMDYLASTLKKIQAVSQMVSQLVRAD